MKIVINKCYGGFSVSKEVFDFLDIEWSGFGGLYNEDFGIDNPSSYFEYRTNPRLIEAIKILGLEASNGKYADLAIIEIPDGIDYNIAEYGGKEWVEEPHRTWS